MRYYIAEKEYYHTNMSPVLYTKKSSALNCNRHILTRKTTKLIGHSENAQMDSLSHQKLLSSNNDISSFKSQITRNFSNYTKRCKIFSGQTVKFSLISQPRSVSPNQLPFYHGTLQSVTRQMVKLTIFHISLRYIILDHQLLFKIKTIE